MGSKATFSRCLMNGVLDGAAIHWPHRFIPILPETIALRGGAVERASPDIDASSPRGWDAWLPDAEDFLKEVRKPQAIFGNGPAPVRTRTPPSLAAIVLAPRKTGVLRIQSFHFLVLRKLLLRSHLVYLLCGAKFLNGRFSPSRVSSAAPAKRRTTQTKTNRLVPPSLS